MVKEEEEEPGQEMELDEWHIRNQVGRDDEGGGLLRAWLDEEMPDGMSAAQLAHHLLLQGWRNPGPLQDYLDWCLCPTELTGERTTLA